MNDKQRENLNMMGRVQTFGRNNSASFVAGTREERLLRRLDAAIEAANRAATTQSGGVGGTIVTKSAAMVDLQRTMATIARTARAIDEEERPGTARDFHLPAGNNAADWLSRARSFYDKSEALNDLFIEFKLPASFRQDLLDDIAAYENATDDAQTGQQTSVGGTKSLAQVLSEGMKVIRQLDGIVPNMFGEQADKMGEWKTARHVVRPDRPQPAAPVS